MRAPCENYTTFDTLGLHKIVGYQHFFHPNHIAIAPTNAKLIHTSNLPPTLGSFAITFNPPAGKTIRKCRRFLDKCHMDIVYGDTLSLGGFCYALILVDVATRYCWIYGLTSLNSFAIIDALEQFHADANGLPKTFHTNFDTKFIGGQAHKWIITNKCQIIATPSVQV